jgi:hypothetical protein
MRRRGAGRPELWTRLSIVDGTEERTPNAAAWDNPGTRKRWGRFRLVGLVQLAVGLACLLAFGYQIDRLAANRADLVQHGIEVTGVVLASPPQALRCGPVPVPVRYPVQGRSETHTLYVDGCGSGLSEGDRLTIFYDPTNPSRFITSDQDNEQPLSELLSIISLVGSVFFCPYGLNRLVNARRLRRTLRAGHWVSESATVAPLRRFGIRGYAIRVGGDRGSEDLLASSSASRVLAGHVSDLYIAADREDEYAVSRFPAGPVARAHRPKGERARERLRRALTADAGRRAPTSEQAS